MPTGTAIRDVRAQLFAAAERVLLRAGPEGLTSRAVTAEAGVAKGVLHRHFADFDAFLAELIRDRIARLDTQASSLTAVAGTGTVAGNVTQALFELFDPVTVGIVGLVIFRDELRARLRATTPSGIPLLAEGIQMVRSYLADEVELGRLAADTDAATLALTLVGTGHLLFADREAGPPDTEAVESMVGLVLADVVQRRLL